MQVGDKVLIQTHNKEWNGEIIGTGIDNLHGTEPVFRVRGIHFASGGIAAFYQDARPDGRHFNVGNNAFWIISIPSRKEQHDMSSSEDWAIQAFVDAHPQWKRFQSELTESEHDGWHYISFRDLEVGRVKIDGMTIPSELLIGYQKLGE